MTDFVYEYSLRVTGNTNIAYTVPSGASYAGAASFKLKKGANTVVLPVKSQSGYTNNYKIFVEATTDCTLTVGSDIPPQKFMRGDVNGDGFIDIVDLAMVKRHILRVHPLEGDSKLAADVYPDGEIDILDSAKIKRHILRKEILT